MWDVCVMWDVYGALSFVKYLQAMGSTWGLRPKKRFLW